MILFEHLIKLKKMFMTSQNSHFCNRSHSTDTNPNPQTTFTNPISL